MTNCYIDEKSIHEFWKNLKLDEIFKVKFPVNSRIFLERAFQQHPLKTSIPTFDFNIYEMKPSSLNKKQNPQQHKDYKEEDERKEESKK